MAANGSERNGKNQHAFPTQNIPNRENCPTPDLLKAVARKSLPFDHPAVQHVGLCDFCLKDVHRLRTQRRRYRAALIAAILLGIILVGAGLLRSFREDFLHTAPAAEIAVDLRRFAPERGDINNVPSSVPVIPRQNLKLSFVLPVGLESGTYAIRLMDEQLHIVREATGSAVVQNFEVHLSTNLDLSALTPGEYRLWIRRRDRSWREYPLRIR
jgi:hypothetical protein